MLVHLRLGLKRIQWNFADRAPTEVRVVSRDALAGGFQLATTLLGPVHLLFLDLHFSMIANVL